MKEQNIDFKYSSEFLQKINTLQYRDGLICNAFEYEGYNIWHFYQQSIFSEIRVWSKAKKFSLDEVSKKPNFKEAFLLFIITTLSFFGILSAKFRSAKILVFSVDKVTSPAHGNDARLDSLYEVLDTEHVSYCELFHTVLGKTTFKNFMKRKRTAMYFETGEFLFRLLSFFGGASRVRVDEILREINFSVFFSDDEKTFARYLLKRFLSRIAVSRFRISLFRRMVRFLRPRALFTIDDMRNYQEVLLACRFEGVKTYAIQHGQINKYDVGWFLAPEFQGKFISPDTLFLWSSYWRDALLRRKTHISESALVIGGLKEYVSTDSRKAESRNNKEIVILVPYEELAPRKEVADYIRAMLACGNTRVVFKLRPGKSKEEQLLSYGLSAELSNTKFQAVFDINEVLADVSIVAGTHSTILYDLIAHGKRAAYLETNMDYGIEIVENNLADSVSSKNVCADISRIRSLPEEEMVRRKEKLYGKEKMLLSDTLRKAVKDLNTSLIKINKK
jgi:hypothetical protein